MLDAICRGAYNGSTMTDTTASSSPLSDLVHALTGVLAGEVRTDLTTRLLYSTDASIYQVEPLGVVFPRTLDDLAVTMETCAAFGVPVLARGAGSSLAGQAIGPALIVDCARFLNRLVEIDPHSRTALVEPGLILAGLNRAAARHGLQFGPDPASAERATLGGSLANNASGAHSILYGMAADHLLSAEVVLSDGSRATFETVALAEAVRRASGATVEAAIYRAALHIQADCAGAIRQRWPRTWRTASGYALNYLLPWAASAPPIWPDASREWQGGGLAASEPSPFPYPPVLPGSLNLAQLLAGSEGTLAIIRRASVRLVPLPPRTVLGVSSYPSIADACDAVPGLLAGAPSAVELIPQAVIRLARSVPAYAHQLSFVDGFDGGDPAALLVVEFSGADLEQLRQKVRALGRDVLLAETAEQQRQVWAVRKVGLGIMLSRAGDLKPWSFVEDLSVPVEQLGKFVRAMEELLAQHNTTAEIYAHASAGCLHIRPILELKTIAGLAMLRSIASQAVNLTLDLGGAVSGEHGDGIARSEWLERMFGPDITAAFRLLKDAADPRGLLNPGKILDAPPMDTHLRFGAGYQTRNLETTLSFASQAGFAGAVEMCNGAGVCRKADGVMCPSFQATQEEMDSTRGRANLLRAMLSGRFPTQRLAEKTVYEALDLCLACKGCKAECPSAVDMAKLRYEFLNYYYSRKSATQARHRLRDFLFGYIAPLAWLGHYFAPLVNPLLQNGMVVRLAERFFGLAHQRPFPRLAWRSLRSQLRRPMPPSGQQECVLFLSDAFTEFFHPQAGLAAIQALQAAGCVVEILPVIGAGRTLISKGFLEAARAHARRVLEAIERLDPQGQIPVVGVEPSEIYTLRDEYLDLWPEDERAQALAERAYMIDEFLVRPGVTGQMRLLRIVNDGPPAASQAPDAGRTVLLHGHCYQKAQPPAADGFPTGVAATVTMLKSAGYQVEVIDSSCCGMAGAFGYEAEHYALSLQVGELGLFPAIRRAGDEVIVAASGVSCQAQIEDGAQRQAVHPITLI